MKNSKGTVENFPNLKPFNKMPEDEVKRITTMGGKASGEARRAKASIKQQMKILLESRFGQDQKQGTELVATSLLKQALDKGNIKAIELILKLMGEMTEQLDITNSDGSLSGKKDFTMSELEEELKNRGYPTNFLTKKK